MHDGRMVVALFGSPGAGKSTLARVSGLTVYDRDDAEWRTRGERAFAAALARLATADARAVVIRSGATSSSRHQTLAAIRATHGFIVTASERECHKRVARRGRSDRDRGQGAVTKWFDVFDHDDRLPEWPEGGWPAVFDMPPFISELRRRKPPPASRGYGPAHRAMRRAVAVDVAAGRGVCAKCGQPIRPNDKWDLGHSDDRATYTGPEHASCNRSAGASYGNRLRSDRAGEPPPPPGW